MGCESSVKFHTSLHRSSRTPWTSSVLDGVRVRNGEEPSSGKRHDLQDFRRGAERCTSPAQLRCINILDVEGQHKETINFYFL